MRHFHLQIKWAYQRVTRGYDDRITWGFDSYMENMMLPLKEFCLKELEDGQMVVMNPQRAKVYKKTVSLIEDWQNQTPEESVFNTKFEPLSAFVGKNIGWYWD